jgi:HSP20 family protein
VCARTAARRVHPPALLGDTLDADRIDAPYHDGVLRLIIPVAEKAKPRRIKVVSENERKLLGD